MILHGAKIDNEDFKIDFECEEKIRQIVSTVKNISPQSNVRMRLVKCGHLCEGLLWGELGNIPLEAYHKSASPAQVLEAFHKKVKKDCLRIWKLRGLESEARIPSRGQLPWAEVG